MIFSKRMEDLLGLSKGGIRRDLLLMFFAKGKHCHPFRFGSLVDYNLDGFVIKLPKSSQLPYYREMLPNLNTNLARIAVEVQKKYPDLCVIDIGANVGDTAAVMRAKAHFPILCVDGEDAFFSLLEENAKVLGGDIELEHSYISDTSGTIKAAVDSHAGTAQLVAAENGPTLKTKTLRQILEAHPRFAKSKLIKVDTDGYDCRILKGQMDLLKNLKSVLYFEYDPHLFGLANDNGFEIFAALRKADYKTILVFENTGDYLLTADLSDSRLIEDVHKFYSGRNAHRYCDICAFHAEDADLVEQVRQEELQFFSKR